MMDMPSMGNCFEYTILLPETTDSEVLEWFAFMNSQNTLSGEIIRFIKEYIKTNKVLDSDAIEQPLNNNFYMSNSEDLFSSLYNYSGSSNALFEEPKKPKKKMLSV